MANKHKNDENFVNKALGLNTSLNNDIDYINGVKENEGYQNLISSIKNIYNYTISDSNLDKSSENIAISILEDEMKTLSLSLQEAYKDNDTFENISDSANQEKIIKAIQGKNNPLMAQFKKEVNSYVNKITDEKEKIYISINKVQQEEAIMQMKYISEIANIIKDEELTSIVNAGIEKIKTVKLGEKTILKKNNEEKNHIIDFATHHAAVVVGQNTQKIQKKLTDIFEKQETVLAEFQRRQLQPNQTESLNHFNTGYLTENKNIQIKYKNPNDANFSKNLGASQNGIGNVYSTGELKSDYQVKQHVVSGITPEQRQKAIDSLVAEAIQENGSLAKTMKSIEEQRNQFKNNNESFNKLKKDENIIDFEFTFDEEDLSNSFNEVKRNLTTVGVANQETAGQKKGALLLTGLNDLEKTFYFLTSNQKGAIDPRNALAKKMGLGEAKVDTSGKVFYEARDKLKNKVRKITDDELRDIIDQYLDLYNTSEDEGGWRGVKGNQGYTTSHGSQLELLGQAEKYAITTLEYISDKYISNGIIFGASKAELEEYNKAAAAINATKSKKDKKLAMMNESQHVDILETIDKRRGHNKWGGLSVENLAKIFIPDYDPSSAHGEESDSYYEAMILNYFRQKLSLMDVQIDEIYAAGLAAYKKMYPENSVTTEIINGEERPNKQFSSFMRDFVSTLANTMQKEPVIPKYNKEDQKYLQNLAQDNNRFMNDLEDEIDKAWGSNKGYKEFFKGDVTRKRIAKETGRKESQVNFTPLKEKLKRFRQEMIEKGFYVDAVLVDDNGIKKIRMRLIPMKDYMVDNERITDEDYTSFLDFELEDDQSRLSEHNDASVVMLEDSIKTGDLTDSIAKKADATINTYKYKYADKILAGEASAKTASGHAAGSGSYAARHNESKAIASDVKMSKAGKERLQSETSFSQSFSDLLVKNKSLHTLLNQTLSKGEKSYNEFSYDLQDLNPSITSDFMHAAYLIGTLTDEELSEWLEDRYNQSDVSNDLVYQLLDPSNPMSKSFRDWVYDRKKKGIIVALSNVSANQAQGGVSTLRDIKSNIFHGAVGAKGAEGWVKTFLSGEHRKKQNEVEDLNKAAGKDIWIKNNIEDYDSYEEGLQAYTKTGILPEELLNMLAESLGSDVSFTDDSLIMGTELAQSLAGEGAETWLNPIDFTSNEAELLKQSLINSQKSDEDKQKIAQIFEGIKKGDKEWADLGDIAVENDTMINGELIRAGSALKRIRNNKGQLQLQYQQNGKIKNGSKILGDLSRVTAAMIGNNERSFSTDEIKQLMVHGMKGVNNGKSIIDSYVEDKFGITDIQQQQKNGTITDEEALNKIAEIKPKMEQYKKILIAIAVNNNSWRALSDIATSEGAGSEKWLDLRVMGQFLIPALQNLINDEDGLSKFAELIEKDQSGILKHAYSVIETKDGKYQVKQNENFDITKFDKDKAKYFQSIQKGNGLFSDIWHAKNKGKYSDEEAEVRYYADLNSGLARYNPSGKSVYTDTYGAGGFANQEADKTHGSARYKQNLSGIKRQQEEHAREASYIMSKVGELTPEEYEKIQNDRIKSQLVQDKKEIEKSEILTSAALLNRGDEESLSRVKVGERIRLSSDSTDKFNFNLADELFKNSESLVGPKLKDKDYYTPEEFEKSIFGKIYNNKDFGKLIGHAGEDGVTDVVLSGRNIAEHFLSQIEDEEERKAIRELYKSKGMYDDIHLAMSKLQYKKDEEGKDVVVYDQNMQKNLEVFRAYQAIANGDLEDPSLKYKSRVKEYLQNEQVELAKEQTGRALSLKGGGSGYLNVIAGKKRQWGSHINILTAQDLYRISAENIADAGNSGKQDAVDYAKSLDLKKFKINDKEYENQLKQLENADVSNLSNIELAGKVNNIVDHYIESLAKWANEGGLSKDEQLKRREEVAKTLQIMSSRSPYLTSWSLDTGDVWISDNKKEEDRGNIYISPGKKSATVSGMLNADYDGDVMSIKRSILQAKKDGNKKAEEVYQAQLEYRQAILNDVNETDWGGDPEKALNWEAYNTELTRNINLISKPILEKAFTAFTEFGNQKVGLANYDDEMFRSALLYYKKTEKEGDVYSLWDTSAAIMSDFFTQLGQQTNISAKKISDIMVSKGGLITPGVVEQLYDAAKESYKKEHAGATDDEIITEVGTREQFIENYEDFMKASINTLYTKLDLSEAKVNLENQRKSLEGRGLLSEAEKGQLEEIKRQESVLSELKELLKNKNYGDFMKTLQNELSAVGPNSKSRMNFFSFIQNKEVAKEIEKFAQSEQTKDVTGLNNIRVNKMGHYRATDVTVDENNIPEEDESTKLTKFFGEVKYFFSQIISLLVDIDQKVGGGGKGTGDVNSNYLYNKLAYENNFSGLTEDEREKKLNEMGIRAIGNVKFGKNHSYAESFSKEGVEYIVSSSQLGHGLFSTTDPAVAAKSKAIREILESNREFAPDMNFEAWKNRKWIGLGNDEATGLTATSLAGDIFHKISEDISNDIHKGKTEWLDSDNAKWDSIDETVKNLPQYALLLKLFGGKEDLVQDFINTRYGGSRQAVQGAVLINDADFYKNSAFEKGYGGVVMVRTGEKDESGNDIRTKVGYATTLDRVHYDEKTNTMWSQDMKYKNPNGKVNGEDTFEGIMQKFALVRGLEEILKQKKNKEHVNKQLIEDYLTPFGLDGRIGQDKLQELITNTRNKTTEYVKSAQGQSALMEAGLDMSKFGNTYSLEALFMTAMEYDYQRRKNGGVPAMSEEAAGIYTIGNGPHVNNSGMTKEKTVEAWRASNREFNRLRYQKEQMMMSPGWGSESVMAEASQIDAQMRNALKKKQEFEAAMKADTANRDYYNRELANDTSGVYTNNLRNQLTLTDRLRNTTTGLLSNIIGFSAASKAVNKVSQAFRQVIQYADNLDKKLVDLQIATGATRSETYDMLREYNSLGLELGRTTEAVADAANNWLRAGYKGKEATDLITSSMYLSTLGMMNAEEATNSLISVLKGWRLESEDVIGVVDKLVSVDMQAAVSAGQIASAMRNVNYSAQAAGISMDTLIGILTTNQEITQKGADETGRAWRTIK